MTSASRDRETGAMTAIRFSTSHGQNIQLENIGKGAKWRIANHCGSCATNRGLNKGDNLKFSLTGSGHALLGIMNSKPQTMDIINDVPTSVYTNAHWTHFRFKKQSTVVSLKRHKTREIFYTRGSGKNEEKKKIFVEGRDSDPYVFFEIQFGDLSVEIDSSCAKKPIFFDENCGLNVTLERNKSFAKLRNPNISAICGTDRPLGSGEVVNLNVHPIENATWTFIKLFISNRNSNQAEIQSLVQRNMENYKSMFPCNGIKIDQEGPIQFCLTENGEIAYSFRTHVEKLAIDQTRIDLSAPIFLFAELFRVRVEIESTLPEKIDETYVRTCDHTYITPIAQPEDELKLDFPGEPSSIGPCSLGYTPLIPQEESLDEQTMLKVVSLNTSVTDVKQLYIKPVWDDTVDPQQECGMTGSTEKMISRTRSMEYHVRAVPEEHTPARPATLPRPPRPPVQGDGAAASEAPPSIPPRKHRGHPGTDGPGYVNQPESRAPSAAGAQVPGVGNQAQATEFSELIRGNYTDLLDRLEPDLLADHLYEKNKMPQYEHDDYLTITSRRQRCRRVLRVLQRDPDSKGVFIRAMKKSAQGNILNKLGLLDSHLDS